MSATTVICPCGNVHRCAYPLCAEGKRLNAKPVASDYVPPAPAKGTLERQTYTVDEAAKMLGICRNQAYVAARSGQIPTIKIGKRLLVLKIPFDKLFG